MWSRRREDAGKARGAARAQVTRWAAVAERLRGGWWHGGVLEGSVAAAMIAGTSALAGFAWDGALVALAFCGTLLVYYLDRTPALSPEDRANHPARWRWRHRHSRWAAVLAGGAALGACWAVLHLRGRTLAVGALLAVPAAVYALPLFAAAASPPGTGPAGGLHRFKDIGPAKPFVVAGVWAAGATLLPALEADASHAAAAGPLTLLAGYRFLFVLPNLLVADAADRAGDARAGLRTVATHWPPSRLRRLAAGALAAALLGGGGALGLGTAAPALLAVDLGGPALLLALLVWHSDRPARRPLAHAADAVMLWPACTALAMGWV